MHWWELEELTTANRCIPAAKLCCASIWQYKYNADQNIMAEAFYIQVRLSHFKMLSMPYSGKQYSNMVQTDLVKQLSFLVKVFKILHLLLLHKHSEKFLNILWKKSFLVVSFLSDIGMEVIQSHSKVPRSTEGIDFPWREALFTVLQSFPVHTTDLSLI